MPSRLMLVVITAALLGGCGKQSEQALNDSYDKNFKASCVASAVKGSMPAPLAEQACGCTIDAINKRYSAAEKLVLPAEKLQPMMIDCLNKVVQQ